MNGIPWAALVPVIVLQLLLMIFAAVSCVRAEETNGPKWMWLLIILLGSVIGPVAFFVAGRRNT